MLKSTLAFPDLQVISNRMQKSVLVAIDRLVRNKKYNRVLKRTTKLMVSGWRLQYFFRCTLRSCRTCE